MKQPLVEGVDYYMEGDRLVFSAVYHQKRGYCCNSKCRHCPFKNAPDGDLAPDLRILIDGVALPIKPR